jgi:DNA mismatch repair ATPase MutS
MRTLDALNENTSSFYAELKRLKTVLDAVDESDNVYFLLDEILKGTNSNDRHTGAKALIKGLLKKNGAGLISTHDLELGNLASEHPDQLENVCFEVDIKEDQLFFDYKLKKGVSKSFNATHLMRSMGIEV